MKTRLGIGNLLFVAAMLPLATSAQSPRADILSMAGGQREVLDAAYSPDGSVLASGGTFGDTIKLWRASDGGMIRTFGSRVGTTPIFGPMIPITFFPDGRTIIAIGEASRIGFWNVADGALLRTLPIQGRDLALNREGTLIAVAARTGIMLVDVADGAVARSIPWTGGVESVRFSPDGLVVAGGDTSGRLRTFRVADGAPLLEVQAHSGTLKALRFSPDGMRIATGSYDRLVRLWDSTTGKLIETLTGHTGNVEAIAYSPDGAWLASGSRDTTVKLWAMPSGTLAGTLPQPRAVEGVNFDPTSSRLAVSATSELREWDVASQTLLRNLVRTSGRISAVRFTPDGTTLISGGYDGKVTITDAATGRFVRQIAAGGGSGAVFALATTAETIAVALNVPIAVKLFRLSDGELLRTMNLPPLAYARSAAFSPDGTLLVTGHFGHLVRLWRVEDGELLETFATSGASGDVNGVAFTSDGKRIVTAASDGFVRVWDTKGTPIRAMGPAGQVYTCLALSPNEQFVLAGGTLGAIQLWRIDDGALVYSFTDPGNKDVTQVRFTPDGDAFYAGRSDNSSTPGSLRIYRTSDHLALGSYTLETGVIGNNPTGPLALDVSPDGKHLAYGREDATVVLAHNSLIAAPTSVKAPAGEIVKGSLAELVVRDGKPLVARPTSSTVELELTAHLAKTDPASLALQIIGSTKVDGVQQEIWMRNAASGKLELVDHQSTKATDQTTRINLGSKFARFIDGGGNVTGRVKWSLPPPIGDRGEGPLKEWEVSLDQAIWAAGL